MEVRVLGWRLVTWAPVLANAGDWSKAIHVYLLNCPYLTAANAMHSPISRRQICISAVYPTNIRNQTYIYLKWTMLCQLIVPGTWTWRDKSVLYFSRVRLSTARDWMCDSFGHCEIKKLFVDPENLDLLTWRH